MRWIIAGVLAIGLAGCSGGGGKSESPAEVSPKKAEQAPEKFHVKFETTKGDIVMEVVRDWAPLGVDLFHDLIQQKYYDGARFFRVRPKFIVQFGIPSDPKVSELWRQLKLADDPVRQKNARGFVSYATSGPGTRTTQVFINLADNSQRLDSRGFAPFARVVEGMDVAESLYASYGEVQTLGGGGPDPQKIESIGESYLERMYPRLDKINRASVVDYTPKL